MVLHQLCERGNRPEVVFWCAAENGDDGMDVVVVEAGVAACGGKVGDVEARDDGAGDGGGVDQP